jgi:hypothetical protein
MQRDEILRRAAVIVTGPRQNTYGSAEANFTRIARLWSAYLDYPVTTNDVACMMTILKIARLASAEGAQHIDSWIDACGYMAIGGELSGAEEVGADA